MSMKYVMFRGNTSFLIFPEGMQHDEVALRGVEIPSAGFVNLVQDPEDEDRMVAKCFGRSESLGKDSRPDHDSLVITIALNQ